MRRPEYVYGLEVQNIIEPPRDGYSVPYNEREIIAWDGEGMNLSGRGKPQHYVLFGSSAEEPIIHKNLGTGELLDHIIQVGIKHPKAVHVSYSFKYDVNMIIKNLTAWQKLCLKNDGFVSVANRWGHLPETWGYRYRLEYTPGKIFKVTRINRTNHKDRVTVRIDDVFSFFARKFLIAVESILQDELTDEDREVIQHGKDARGDTTWEDLPEVTRYWRAEIRLMKRMMEVFRDVMFKAGFKLNQWYGPGAIASYLLRTKKLKQHIQNQPLIPEVHEASKYAYAGGRFELFQIGRFTGPVYGYDINSAYPYALSNAPSLGLDHGAWQYQPSPTRIAEFGVYRISYRHQNRPLPLEFRAMPLFHRDPRGSISFPNAVDGWYWSPEAAVVKAIGDRIGGVTIHEGWVWENDGNRPFKFLEEMFNKRLEIGKHNVASMPFKLGPNSMYGKFAQRVGKDNDKRPPASHCLPLAGWITSRCRAELYKVILQVPPKDLIAVETDGIYTTVPPEKLRHMSFGNGLGEWGVDRYDEMLYLQNGIYHKFRDGKWEEPKSRGLDISSVPRTMVEQYFQDCRPGDFPVLNVKLKDRFIGLSAALAGGPDKVAERHCVWVPGERDIQPAGKGKRIHSPKSCPSCAAGLTAWDAPHPLAIHSRAGVETPLMSTPHTLPWESKPLPGVAAARRIEEIEKDLI
ncbi:MAG TPA: DNA polymerase [Candidatus Paceibacterota bacterium]